ncbi:MAG: glycosyl transferase family 1 [Erythrobacter sp.]|nr:glycosyl transferase family 1 [Erythrobacter sp.]
MAKPRILHCLAHDGGAAAALTATLIGHLNGAVEHSVVLAAPSQGGSLTTGTIAAKPARFPAFGGAPTPGKLFRLAQAMAPFDLVLTHDYGALGATMAHTAFSQMLNLPPLIHHEYGFGEADDRELAARRTWYRRIALGRASGLVVPSEYLEELALTRWHQPLGRVRHIWPGVDLGRFTGRPRPDALRGIVKREGEIWIGAMDAMEGETGLLALVGAMPRLPESWHLVLAGEGPAREIVRREAERLELSHRVHLPGRIDDRATFLRLLDIFAVAEVRAAFPAVIPEAMAAGLPIVAPARHTLGAVVGEENARLIVDPAADGAGLANAVSELAGDITLRLRAGQQNRILAEARFDRSTMIDRSHALYSSALGRELAA